MHISSRHFSKINDVEFLINVSDIERAGIKFEWNFLYPQGDGTGGHTPASEKGVFLYHAFDGHEHPEVLKFNLYKTKRDTEGHIEKWMLELTPEMKSLVPTKSRRAKMVIINV